MDMHAHPEPAWPVVALAGLQLVDGALCIRAIEPIARCFEDVRLPRPFWPVTPVVKVTAAGGLLAGLRVPYLGAVTASAMVAYVVGAIGMHVRARDLGRNLFVNASGMLAICVGTTVACFVVGGERAGGR